MLEKLYEMDAYVWLKCLELNKDMLESRPEDLVVTMYIEPIRGKDASSSTADRRPG